MHQKAFGGRAPPGPVGELKRSPRPPSRNMGSTSKGVGIGEGRGGEEEREKTGGEGRERIGEGGEVKWGDS